MSKMPIDTLEQIASLTDFELKILQDKACGLSDAEMGEKQNETDIEKIKQWLKVIYRKLGYKQHNNVTNDIRNTCARAVCAVLREGMIEGPPKIGPIPQLDREELSVLDYVSLGYSSSQISEYLNIGEDAVKTRVRTAGDKLGIPSNNRILTATTAIVHGLI